MIFRGVVFRRTMQGRAACENGPRSKDALLRRCAPQFFLFHVFAVAYRREAALTIRHGRRRCCVAPYFVVLIERPSARFTGRAERRGRPLAAAPRQ